MVPSKKKLGCVPIISVGDDIKEKGERHRHQDLPLSWSRKHVIWKGEKGLIFFRKTLANVVGGDSLVRGRQGRRQETS